MNYIKSRESHHCLKKEVKKDKHRKYNSQTALDALYSYSYNFSMF